MSSYQLYLATRNRLKQKKILRIGMSMEKKGKMSKDRITQIQKNKMNQTIPTIVGENIKIRCPQDSAQVVPVKYPVAKVKNKVAELEVRKGRKGPKSLKDRIDSIK